MPVIRDTDLDLLWIPDFFSRAKADSFFEAIVKSTDWKHRSIRMFGRDIMQPRLTAWIADAEVVYTYSDLRWEPEPWTKELSKVRTQLEELIQTQLNSVLLNYYRDGSDSMGYHADDETELGEQPIIVSASFGSTRRFHLNTKI